ncbi:MAG TPA: sensor domain-containing protein, partial [Actinomycetota bacterium]|nr:sensor domain-containing protein [Actinomycetota bacterium]
MIRTTASPAPGRRPGGGAAAAARAALAAPFTRRARLELLFCLASVPLGFCLFLVPYWVAGPALAVALLAPRYDSTWVAAVPSSLAVLALVMLATRIARGLGAVHRRLAARLL